VTPLLGAAATEGALKKAPSPQVLHMATHGFFLPDPEPAADEELLVQFFPGSPSAARQRRLAATENPLLRSGLALSGANTWLEGGPLPEEAEDAILNAVDVTGMDLLGTDLVVLSACETALGQVRAGEGVFGLRRAFVLAGAKTLVMSLWQVPDEETRELMIAFYKRILAGEPRVQALRQAQLAVKERHPEPYFWGAFICQGDPGPVPAA
jgi:CHAT domain-containing protein